MTNQPVDPTFDTEIKGILGVLDAQGFTYERRGTLSADIHTLGVYSDETPAWRRVLRAQPRVRLIAVIMVDLRDAGGVFTQIDGYGADTSELILDLARAINALGDFGKVDTGIKSSNKLYGSDRDSRYP